MKQPDSNRALEPHLYFRFPIMICLLACLLTVGQVQSAQTQQKKLIAVYPRHFPPIYSVTKNTVPTGFAIEFMELIAKDADLDIEYQDQPNWEASIAKFERGEADLIPNLGITPERKKVFDFSNPYDQFSLSIFVKKNHKDVNNITELFNLRVGVVRNNHAKILMQKFPHILTTYYPSLGDLVAALVNEEVDAVIYPDIVFNSFAIKLGIADKIKMTGDPISRVERAIAVRKGNIELLKKMNHSIEKILTTKEYKVVYDRWHLKPEPFWTSTRVALLVGGIFVIYLVIWFFARYHTLRNINKRLNQSNTLTRAILDATSDGIITINESGRIISCNSAAETIFDNVSTELIGEQLTDYLFDTEAKNVIQHLILIKDSSVFRGTQENISYSLECTILDRSRKQIRVRMGIAPMKNDDVYNFVCTFHDETRVWQAEIQAEHLVNHDPLTGLLNHRAADHLLTMLITEGKTNLSCLCLGLPHLSRVNSVYGREFGDQVVLQVGVMLKKIANQSRNIEFVARNTGNRFIILVSGHESYLEEIITTINNELTDLEVRYENELKRIEVDHAIGIAFYPEHAVTSSELFNHSEIAYINAKKDNYEHLNIYDPDEKQLQSEYEYSLQRIKSAMNSDRIILNYQPVMHIKSGQIAHYEALLRMYDENGSIMMPSEIIPIAETFDLITQIDYIVFQHALAKLAELKSHHPDVSIAVNLSAAHLGDSKLYDLIKENMEKHDINYANLTFEITESAALQNFASAGNFMQNLINLGCSFALDDFGVGFTSFVHLRTLPVDIVKIDGMFIKDLHNNKHDQVFVKAITDVAHDLGKQVVAEFVENHEILHYLQKLGVDYAQGYYIGRPDPELLFEKEDRDAVS